MEKVKQCAKIFDNLGLAAIASAATVWLRDKSGVDCKFHFNIHVGDANWLILEAIFLYVGFQLISIWILNAVDKRK